MSRHTQAEHLYAQAEHPPDRMSSLAQNLPVHNRLAAVMAHVPWYGFCGQARLARDARVSRAALSRLIAGHTRPSFQLVWALSRALESRLNRPLDPRELVSFDGTYPTPSACDLTGCRGCLPDWAYDATGSLRPTFQGQAPGEWSRTVGDWSRTAGEWPAAQREQRVPLDLQPGLEAVPAAPGVLPSADRRRGSKWGRG